MPLEFTDGSLLDSWREFLQLNRHDPRALCLFVHVVYLMSFNAGYMFRLNLRRQIMFLEMKLKETLY